MRSWTICCAVLGLILALPARARADTQQQLEALATALERIGRADDAARFRAAVAAVPTQTLEAIYGDTDLAPLADRLYQTAQVTQTVAEVMSSTRAAQAASAAARAQAAATRTATATVQSGANGALPDAPFPIDDICPLHAQATLGQKSDTHDGLENMNYIAQSSKAIEQAEILYSFAKGVWDALDKLCEETIVAVGNGENEAEACIPIDIVLGVFEFAVSEADWAFEFKRQNAEQTDACDKAVETAEIVGSYNRVAHVHDDIASFKQDVDGQLDELEAKWNLVLRVLLESDLHTGSVSRLNVNYTDRLDAACTAAQEAIDHAAALHYAPTPGPQAMLDQGRKLSKSDPMQAFDLCQQAYRLVTTREPVRR